MTGASARRRPCRRCSALVVIEGPLVVLARFQRNDRAAVGQCLDAGLIAVEPLLDDQAVAGLAKDPPDHDLIDGVECLPQIVADVDPLAGGQAVGFEHQAKRPPQDEIAGVGDRVEDAAVAALFNLDLNTGAEHLTRVEDPFDRLHGLAGGPAMQRVPDGRSSLERTTSETSRDRM